MYDHDNFSPSHALAAAGGGAGGGAVPEEPDAHEPGPRLRGAVCPEARPARGAPGEQQAKLRIYYRLPQ